MKVSQAVDFHLQYHRANKKNTIKTCEFVLTRFTARFGKRDLASISQEEVGISAFANPKQQTGHEKKQIFGACLALRFTSFLLLQDQY